MNEVAVEGLAGIRATEQFPVPAFWLFGLLAAAAWLVAAAITSTLPDAFDVDYTPLLAELESLVGGLLILAFLLGRRLGRFGARLRHAGAWFLALGLFLLAWEALTAKFGVLPRPFFAAPQKVLAAFVDDWPRLLLCVYYSLRLLTAGVVTGATLGFMAGVAIGWSPLARYWGHPLLRFIGPIPPTAWLPFAVFAFPNSFSASTFLIALAMGMPVTVLTWSGVASVNCTYYDVARTLGARERFLIFKVAIPAAMPHVFVGMFMGLSFSFAVLMVAELLGVKAGLGWYMQWAQGWSAYGNMYAALLVLAAMCSTLISLLFLGRDRLLGWQKGLLRW
jgi:NitT/TauT family transport system permease protein